MWLKAVHGHETTCCTAIFGTYDLARGRSSLGGDAGGGPDCWSTSGSRRTGGRRFALWSMLYMLGRAPDLDVAFEDEADREAARNLMDMLAASGEQ